MKLALTLLFCAATSALLANDDSNFPFRVGEKLTYQILWGPFVAGHATLEVTGIDNVDEKDCYHLVGKANTSGFIDLIYPVKSQVDSWLDTNSLFTRRFQQNRLEGKRRTMTDSHYDYRSNQLVTTNLVNGRSKTTALTNAVQDVLSAFFYVRTKDLQVNINQGFPINLSGDYHDVQVCPDERKKLFFRPTGEISALHIEPRPTFSMVAANGGRMWFWVSDDTRKLPLLLVSEIKLGSLKLILTGIQSAAAAVPGKQTLASH